MPEAAKLRPSALDALLHPAPVLVPPLLAVAATCGGWWIAAPLRRAIRSALSSSSKSTRSWRFRRICAAQGAGTVPGMVTFDLQGRATGCADIRIVIREGALLGRDACPARCLSPRLQLSWLTDP